MGCSGLARGGTDETADDDEHVDDGESDCRLASRDGEDDRRRGCEEAQKHDSLRRKVHTSKMEGRE
jgi:hypothetical protein